MKKLRKLNNDSVQIKETTFNKYLINDNDKSFESKYLDMNKKYENLMIEKNEILSKLKQKIIYKNLREDFLKKYNEEKQNNIFKFEEICKKQKTTNFINKTKYYLVHKLIDNNCSMFKEKTTEHFSEILKREEIFVYTSLYYYVLDHKNEITYIFDDLFYHLNIKSKFGKEHQEDYYTILFDFYLTN